MKKSHQKKIFLKDEGDAWFNRNHESIQNKIFNAQDPVISSIIRCLDANPSKGRIKLLEVGCGEGKRLSWITTNLDVECYGVDPSKKAVVIAEEIGVSAIQGTADNLPYSDSVFDIIVFGFCLYLCDREDLFRIAFEADRVIKPESWVIIHDFYSDVPLKKNYHHKPGIFSYKMDYRTLFNWHPAYSCIYHEIKHHNLDSFTDEKDEWVGISILRKKS
jgi:ubiquinone/menaquinone biosynthesis C-methylase UbiE